MRKKGKQGLSGFLMTGVSLTVVAGIALAGAAQAQAQAQPSGSATDASKADDEVVVVVGVRAAQQSALDRKKRAKTPTDSIVADDVGAFPDRNISEAISRVAGVAVDRNEFGEGSGLNIRGNGADLTRVELDGIGVQNAGGLAIGAGSSDARGADMRELPSDLIKSVDIVKGSTADMTEGSLGGSVNITTRTGLDFKKPYMSLRYGVTQNSLGKEYRPDLNLVMSRKFLNNRLGVLFSLSSSKIQNNGHNMSMVTSDNAGYARAMDWDNSPEKTFTFNPATVTGDGANTPLVTWANAAGTGSINAKTPLELVTLASQAKTKNDCNTLFPTLSDTELGLIAAGTSSNNRNAAQNQRMYERVTCLNQWNDYSPSLIRNFLNSNDDNRLAADIRFDYKVNDRFTVYAKYGVANRHVDDQFRNRNLGGLAINTAGTFVDSISGGTNGLFYPNGTIDNRTPVAGSGYYLYNAGYTTGPITIDTNPAAGTASANITNAAFPVYGLVANVDPTTIKVDANHHVTQFGITDGAVGIDQISTTTLTDSAYMQFGGDYKHGPLRVQFVLNRGESTYSRDDRRTSISAPYGKALLTVSSAGIWGYELPAGFDQTNPDNFVVVRPATANANATAATYFTPASPAYTIAQLPLTTGSFGITFQPRMQENSEETAKFDITYNVEDKLPFFTQFKTGYSKRDTELDYWGSGGYTVKEAVGSYLNSNGTVNTSYVPPIVVPTLNLRGSFRACLPTATSTQSCNYGYKANTEPGPSLTGVSTFTPDELKEIFRGIFLPADSQFFDGYPGAAGLTSWPGLDIRKLWSQIGAAQNANFDCIKVCRGSDGQMYEQPKFHSEEHVSAAYFMTDFEQNLPLGVVFNGNMGLRMVETEVVGTGTFQLNSIRKTAAFNPLTPTAAAGISTFTFRKPVSLEGKYRDWLPSYNANLWIIPDKVVMRYSWGKTVARPRIDRMVPAGNCTFDERTDGVLETDGTPGDMTCNGTLGNPNLKPYKASNEQTTIEWYPNKDTMFSLAYHKLDVKIGGPVAVTKSDGKLFEGTALVDPQTGQPVDNLEFTYTQWENDVGYGRTGWEFTSKTAFTFLPWYLRYTGADFNISTLAGTTAVDIRDPNSGDKMRTPGEADYYANLSLWYDDGKLSSRVSYQKRTDTFSCIAPCGNANTVNNYPGSFGPTNVARPAPYNPGAPRFTQATAYLDAKVTYKLNSNVEVYLEGRNLTKQGTGFTGGDYNGFAGGVENLWRLSYGGVRTMFGVNLKR